MGIYKTAEKSALMIKHAPEDFECYVCVGKGWEGIVHRLTEQIAQLDPNFKINQVKEKFGGLRYYASISTDIADTTRECISILVNKAEHEASVTCECCGSQRGVNRKSMSCGWVVTACDTCRDALEQERKDDTS